MELLYLSQNRVGKSLLWTQCFTQHFPRIWAAVGGASGLLGQGIPQSWGGRWVVWGSLSPQGLSPNCSETTDTQGLIVDGHPT